MKISDKNMEVILIINVLFSLIGIDFTGHALGKVYEELCYYEMDLENYCENRLKGIIQEI